MAWGVAASCMILIMLASTRPAWFEFDFSTVQQPPLTSPALTAPATHVVTQQRNTQAKLPAQPHPAAVKKTPTLHAKTNTAPYPAKKHTAIADGFYIQL